MAATRATAALDAAGVSYLLHAYDHDPANSNYGAEAVAALGIEADRMFKTLVVDIGQQHSELAVAVVPVSCQLSLKQFAQAVGAKRSAMAAPAVVERSTGYVLGGVSPLGQKVSLTTVIDETAQLWETIFVSAGRRGLDIEVSPLALAELAGARFADIAR